MVPFYIDLRPEAGCTFAHFWGLFCVTMKDAISYQIEQNILRYMIPVYINIHKKHYFNVCVFLPSKGTGYIGWCQCIQWRPSIKKHVEN